MHKEGENYGTTFVKGVESMQTASYNAGYKLGQAANRGQKAALAIKSPSREAKENAQNFAKSFIDNLSGMAGKAKLASEKFTKIAMPDLSLSMGRITPQYAIDTSTHVSNVVNERSQPAYITLKLGNKSFEAFVDDISHIQDVSTQLELSYT